VLASGKSVPEAEKALDAQIDNILKNGVTEDELKKAKNQFLTGKLRELQTNNGKASALGEAAVIYGDPERINTDLAKLQAITADQVKNVLNKYIAGKKRVVIEYLPEAMRAATAPSQTPK
jgi:zinc protease